jgi:hypothetical protein
MNSHFEVPPEKGKRVLEALDFPVMIEKIVAIRQNQGLDDHYADELGSLFCGLTDFLDRIDEGRAKGWLRADELKSIKAVQNYLDSISADAESLGARILRYYFEIRIRLAKLMV